jgi:uncharacterized protein YbjT (DUF2867 family)
MTDATLAVTGGTGFVGSALIRMALAQGYRVRALTRRAQPVQDGVAWIEGALDDPDSLLSLIRGSDAVIHIAGVVNTPLRREFEAGNVTGTLNMVHAAKQAGVARFIHVSSLTARMPDISNYGWSKAKAENVVAASGLDWTMVRPPAIYGPGDKDMLDMFKMAQRGFVLLPPTGRLSVLEVSDLCRLLLALVPASEARAQLYEADDGVEGGWSHASFGKAIGRAVGKRVMTLAMPKWVMRAAAKGDRLFRGSGAKLTTDRASYMCHPDWVINPEARPHAQIWVPSVETRSGLKATAAAYRTAGWL